MRNLHVAAIALFIIVALALALPFGQIHTSPAASQAVTGTYFTESDDEMSWIKVTERGKDDVRCEWRKLKLMTDGKVTQQGFSFEGKMKGNRLSMQAYITKPKRTVVFAEAERENGTIRLSISMEGMVFYKARYTPSGMVEVGFAQSRFVEQGRDLIQARKDAAAAQVSPHQAAEQEQMKKDIAIVRQGNQYITGLIEYRKDYPKTIKAYEHNTASMGRYLEQVHGAQKIGQRAYVTQSYMQMQDLLNQTYTLQNEQDAFRERIAQYIKPFIEQMHQQQLLCTQEKVDTETSSMCKVAAALEKSLNKEIIGMEKIFEEIRASYRKNAALQRNAIDEARKVVNPDTVNNTGISTVK